MAVWPASCRMLMTRLRRADGQLPLLLAISDNGRHMKSVSTREFLAGVAIAQQFGRLHTPQGQA